MVRLGLGYDVMSQLNPGIIYLQASAYGPVGPLKGMLSNEWATQAAAAYTSLNGKLGGQPEFLRGSAHLDWNGAMLNCLGILAALHVRNKTGRGVFMETSQLQSTVTGGFTRLTEYFASGESPKPMGSARPNIVPDQAFLTALGYISVSVVHNGIWGRLCQALDLPELADDPTVSPPTRPEWRTGTSLYPSWRADFMKRAGLAVGGDAAAATGCRAASTNTTSPGATWLWSIPRS